jgi:hypothetical protein
MTPGHERGIIDSLFDLVPRETRPRNRALCVAAALFIPVAGLAFLTTAPTTALTFGSEHAYLGVVHGTLGILYLLAGTAVLYLSYRLYTGRLRALRDLIDLTAVALGLAVLVNAAGLWLYRHYRDPAVHGHETVRQWLLANVPEAHTVLFEFKEHVALTTIPLTAAGLYLLVTYRWKAVEDRGLRSLTALLLALAWVAMMGAFVLGAAVTKIRSV